MSHPVSKYRVAHFLSHTSVYHPPPFATSSVATFSLFLVHPQGLFFLCSLIFSQFLLSSSVLSYLFLFTLHNISSRAPDHCPALCAHPTSFFLLSALALCPSLLPLFFVVSGSRALLKLLLMSHMLSLADDPSTLPVWIMHGDYIKISWSYWSIFNWTLLLVKPVSLWSFHVCVAVCVVSVCLLNMTSEQPEIKKGHGPNQTVFLILLVLVISVQTL